MNQDYLCYDVFTENIITYEVLVFKKRVKWEKGKKQWIKKIWK